jgi:hypothetical protein
VSRTKVGVISLGCSKNLVDTEVMLGHLDAAGCAFVQDSDDADVLIVNTCGFIDAAREESVRTILDAAKLKTSGSLKRLVVAGCMVQRYRDELTRELAGDVDAFVGLDELDTIVAAVQTAPRVASSIPLKNDLPMFAPARPVAPGDDRRLQHLRMRRRIGGGKLLGYGTLAIGIMCHAKRHSPPARRMIFHAIDNGFGFRGSADHRNHDPLGPHIAGPGNVVVLFGRNANDGG